MGYMDRRWRKIKDIFLFVGIYFVIFKVKIFNELKYIIKIFYMINVVFFIRLKFCMNFVLFVEI